jgi:hypothetical protein
MMPDYRNQKSGLRIQKRGGLKLLLILEFLTIALFLIPEF